MKKIYVLIAVYLMIFSASLVFAGDSVKNNVEVDANLAQSSTNIMKGGEQEFSVTSTDNSKNDIRSLGSLPEAVTHGAQLPIVPANENGHRIEQFPIERAMQIFPELKYDNFKVFTDNLSRKGMSWTKINGKIKVYPTLINRLPRLADNETVWFPNENEAKKILPLLKMENIVGVYLYDTEFEKWDKVVPTYLQMKGLDDSVNEGGNVCVIFDQFEQIHFLLAGGDFSVAGTIAGIAGSFLRGSAGAANVGVSGGHNTVTGNTGAAVAIIHVDDLRGYQEFARRVEVRVEEKKEVKKTEPPTCNVAKTWEKIKELERELESEVGTSGFHFRHKNLKDRAELGHLYLDVYACTRDKKYLDHAIYNLEVAERNKIYGNDLHLHSDVDMIVTQIEYDLRTAVHARDKSLDTYYNPEIKDIPVIKDIRKKKGIEWERQEVLKLRQIPGSYAVEIKP